MSDEPTHRITMLGKPGCHLCDEALRVIEQVAAEFNVTYDVSDITVADAATKEEYWDKIPVIFVDGAQHDFWRASEKRLRAALSS
ncbi:glutaredoxin family protein [Salinactinospora qingdaonensis]|uniref:Glutaredoxin family protein n=1 Tax=Salinactinospora qingdaonensis TaxID=702744 RepID=A0ABP7F5R7_9ACTN